jgi:DcaP outer membrane protein
MKRQLCRPRLTRGSNEARPGTGRALLAAAGFCLGASAVPAPAQEQVPSLEGMWRIIQQQQAEIDQLKRENAELRGVIAPVPAAAPGVPPEIAAAPPPPPPAGTAASATTIDVYGFAMMDMGYQSGQNDPDWFDVLRPTKLPAFKDEFGEDGEWFTSVRQTRFGVKSSTPTALGDLKTIFEFELFGTGDDAGQTTFRLRHAWGELGQFGAGQYWSTFMDIDVFPNSLEYWGPNGMVFFRNVQARWTPWSDGDSRFAISLERPGASGDRGKFEDRVELEGIQGDFELPDLAAHFRWADDWGHVQIAGILRDIQWKDTNNDALNLGGSDTGWGLNLSGNYRIGPHVLRGSVVYGEGIQNYMNDATADIGVRETFGNPVRPITGEAIPMLGVVAFLDLNWSDRWTSTIGYSMLDNDLPDGQSPGTFEKGQYALTNLLYHPTPSVLYGVELQWGDRENLSNGYSADDVRVQFSAKYSYDKSF